MATEKELQTQEVEKQEIDSGSAERTRGGLVFVPRVDIYETDVEIVILADMPGVDEQSVDITLEKNVLTIDGFVDPFESEDYCLAYAEYRVGDYQRSFTLSNEVDQEKIEASMKDGVLEVHLPKADAVTKKVSVKAG